MTAEINEVKSANWRKKHLGKNSIGKKSCNCNTKQWCTSCYEEKRNYLIPTNPN